MISRDKDLIIVQHRPGFPLYQDAGDSSCRTGLMAMCDSSIDKDLLPLFYLQKVNKLVRHPYQYPYYLPNNFSRDQLLPMIAGLSTAGYHEIVRNIFFDHAKRYFLCQNDESYLYPGKKKILPDGRDILAPDHIWHLIVCGRIWYLYWFGLIGYPWQMLSILWSAFVMPENEQNQLFCMVNSSGLLKLYIKIYGLENFKKNMYDYFGGWRDQKEIAYFVCAYVEGKLNG